MHPLLKHYLNKNKSITQIFQDHPESDNEPITQAIKLLSEYSTIDPAKIKEDKEIQKAISFDLNDSSSTELSLLYLLIKHSIFPLAINTNRHNIYLQKALDILTKKTNSTLKALCYGMFAVRINDYKTDPLATKYFRLLDKTLEFKCYRDFEVVIRFCFLSNAFSGQLIKFKKKIIKIENKITTSALSKKIKEDLQDQLNQIQFIDAVVRGDLKKSKEDLLKIKTHTPQVQRFMVYMYLHKGINQSKDWKGVTIYKKEADIPLWIKVDQALALRQPKKALEYAKTMVSKGFELITNYHYYLLKAELANRDTKASQWLIDKLLSEKNASEDILFFRCRLELLKGNKTKASEYFTTLSKMCEAHHMEGILDHFINLAIEIEPGDLSYLVKRATISKEKFIEPEEDISLQKAVIETIVGNSNETKLLRKMIKKIANLDAPVLITGETGVGKELVAYELHHQSSRSAQPYLTLNCSAIPDTLLQSELFGHEAGAYTSAEKAHKGIFETAGNGSVFLDEFGDISSLLQVSLLRVMEKMEIRPIGSNHTRKIHCRFIIATNANLEEMVQNKLFRKDLYYRIKKLEIQVTPLRKRKSDIRTIALHFLNLDRKGEKASFANSLEEKLTNYLWDGNVRELKSEIEKARLLHSDKLYYEDSDIPLKETSVNTPTDFIDSKNKKPALIASKVTISTTEIKPTEENIFAQDIQQAKLIKSRKRKSDLRKARILNLFNNFDKMYRQEVAEILGVSPRTITNDFKELIDSKVIKKIEPTLSPRSHYFILN